MLSFFWDQFAIITVNSEVSEILDFLEGRGVDHRGRTIPDIISMSDHELEITHDYIQWVFPNQTPSQFNPDAPTTNIESLRKIRASARALQNVHSMLLRMYDFLGLNIVQFEDGNYQLDFHDETRVPHWITAGNHNYFRITRILSALRDLALFKDLEAFLDILDIIGRRYHALIGENTVIRWREFANHLDLSD